MKTSWSRWGPPSGSRREAGKQTVVQQDPSTSKTRGHAILKNNQTLHDSRRYAVKSVASHAKFHNKKLITWKPYNQRYDVAVVTLAEPLTFDDYVQPIGQIAATRVLNRERLLVGGWGTIKVRKSIISLLGH